MCFLRNRMLSKLLPPFSLSPPGWTTGSEAWAGKVGADRIWGGAVSARAKGAHPGNSFSELFVYWEEEGVFMPLGRWSGSLRQSLSVYNWPGTECWKTLPPHTQGLRVGAGEPYKAKQRVKPASCQGNTFLLGLMVRQPTSWHQVGRREGANSCGPHLR